MSRKGTSFTFHFQPSSLHPLHLTSHHSPLPFIISHHSTSTTPCDSQHSSTRPPSRTDHPRLELKLPFDWREFSSFYPSSSLLLPSLSFYSSSVTISLFFEPLLIIVLLFLQHHSSTVSCHIGSFLKVSTSLYPATSQVSVPELDLTTRQTSTQGHTFKARLFSAVLINCFVCFMLVSTHSAFSPIALKHAVKVQLRARQSRLSCIPCPILSKILSPPRCQPQTHPTSILTRISPL